MKPKITKVVAVQVTVVEAVPVAPVLSETLRLTLKVPAAEKLCENVELLPDAPLTLHENVEIVPPESVEVEVKVHELPLHDFEMLAVMWLVVTMAWASLETGPAPLVFTPTTS